MEIYADYSFYSESYNGSSIALENFDRLARRASLMIDELTFDRAATVIEDDEDDDLIERIQMATCAVAEELQAQESGGEVQSERVGNYSVTYVGAQTVSKDQRISRAARPYLGSSGLMYRGFDEDLE
jgi:hypothetical protein